jgi:hypothetical protein
MSDFEIIWARSAEENIWTEEKVTEHGENYTVWSFMICSLNLFCFNRQIEAGNVGGVCNM